MHNKCCCCWHNNNNNYYDEILLETNALYAFDNIGTPGKWRLEISCSMAIWCDRVGSVGILYYGKIKHDYLVCIKYNPCQVTSS